MGATLADVGLTYLGPNMMRVSDRMLALYEAAGFTLLEADKAATSVMSYTLGVASSEAATLTKLARSGLTMKEWIAKVWPAAEQAAQEYPRMKELYAAHLGGLEAVSDSEDGFSYGLDRVLDGLEIRLKG